MYQQTREHFKINVRNIYELSVGCKPDQGEKVENLGISKYLIFRGGAFRTQKTEATKAKGYLV